MKNRILIILCIMCAKVTYSAELKCSANSTRIIFVNGMKNTQGNAYTTMKDIKRTIDPIRESLDLQPRKIDVTYVFNPSLGLTKDAVEHLVDESKARGIQDPWKFLIPSYQHLNIVTAIKNREQFLPATYSVFKNYQFLQVKNSLTKAQSSVTAMQSSNAKLHRELQTLITSTLEGRKKILLVAHSQGNSITKATSLNLPSIIEGEDRVGKYFGVMHVASPINSRAAIKSRLIKIDTDRIVGYLFGASEYPNYELEYSRSEVSSIFDMNIIQDLFYYNSDDLFNHSMSTTYLSAVRKGRKRGSSSGYEPMKKIFQDNIKDLAVELEDNCSTPDIRMSSVDSIVDPITQNLLLDGYASSNRVLRLKITDAGGDLNHDGIDEGSYERSLTEFTYKVTTSHTNSFGLEDHLDLSDGVFIGDSTINIPIPYRDFRYSLTITAKNKTGKTSTVTRNILVTSDKPASVVISDQACILDEHHFNVNRMMSYKVTYSDDSYSVDGMQKNGYITEDDNLYWIQDGLNSRSIVIQNQCSVESSRYRWEVYATCSVAYCINTAAGCDGITDINKYFMRLTGQQTNYIRVFYPDGMLASGPSSLGSGDNSSELGVMAPFIDPNDSANIVYFSKAAACTPDRIENGETEHLIKSGN